MTQLYGIPQDTNNRLNLNAKSLGTLGETTVAKFANRLGFSAHKLREGDKLGDVAVSHPALGMRTIEVKTSMRGARGSFQFCLYRELKGRVCTDHTHADFVMLLCVEDDYSVVALMIPSRELSQKKLEFSDPLTCKYQKFLLWQ